MPRTVEGSSRRANVPLPAEIVNPSELQPTPSIWIFGDSGVGKTHLLGTCDNVLIASIAKEEGAFVMARGGGSNVRTWPIYTTNDLINYYNYVEAGDHPFRVIGIDSLTHLQDIMMLDIVKAEHEANPNKRDADVPALQDYLRFQLRLKKLINRFNALPYAKVYTAARQFFDVEDVDGNPATLHLPQIETKEAKLAMRLCGQMMVVAPYVISTETGKRGLMFQRKGNWFAKDRDGRLGAYMTDPTLDEMFTKMEYSTGG